MTPFVIYLGNSPVQLTSHDNMLNALFWIAACVMYYRERFNSLLFYYQLHRKIQMK